MARRGKGKLTEEAKLFVIAQLAAFEPPSDVAKLVKDNFGVEISAQGVERYDPNKLAGADLPEKYRMLFHRARDTYLTSEADIPIAHRTHRLRRLQRIADRARDNGNVVLEANIIEQAAKEASGTYEGRRKVEGAVAVTGAEGGPVEHRHAWNVDEAMKEALGALAEEE
jgi:hypothetical protein